MSTILLPFDIIAYIIDTVGENGDTNLLKELALVSRCFHQLCCKYLFATVDLSLSGSGSPWNPQVPSPKKRFVRLLESRPDVVKYIRELTYEVEWLNDPPLSLPSQSTEDYLLSPILPNILRTITRLNYLTIDASNLSWNEINPYLTSAFLHLMHLPTINHIGLSLIRNFPMSSLSPSVNLLWLELSCMSFIDPLEKEIVVQSEMMPKLRELHTPGSFELTMMLLHAKTQDGQPAFNIMNLRRFSSYFEDKWDLLYLLQNAKLLEILHLTVEEGESLEGLHEILSASPRTLNVLAFLAFVYETSDGFFPQPLEGVCEGLEALAGHNRLEDIIFEFKVSADYDETEGAIGSLIEDVKKLLAKPGWSALRRVYFKVLIFRSLVVKNAELLEALRTLFDKHFSHSSKVGSVALNFSVYIV